MTLVSIGLFRGQLVAQLKKWSISLIGSITPVNRRGAVETLKKVSVLPDRKRVRLLIDVSGRGAAGNERPGWRDQLAQTLHSLIVVPRGQNRAHD